MSDSSIPDPIESPAPASVPEAPPIPPAEGPAPKRKRGRPRSGDGPTRPVGRPTKRALTHEARAERVSALYGQLGGASQMLLVVPLPDLAVERIATVGGELVTNADQLGEAWATWADTSERVAAMIDGLSFGGGALGVLMAHVPIVLALINPRPLDPSTAAFVQQARSMFSGGLVVPDLGPDGARLDG